MKVIITDEILGYQPYRTGMIDAKRGKAPAPQTFVNPDSMVHYLLGYESIKDQTPETQRMLQELDSPAIARELTELEWQIQYKDTVKEDTWHWLTEEQVRRHLQSVYYDVEAIMEVMRENTGKPIAGSAFANFRHYKEE